MKRERGILRRKAISAVVCISLLSSTAVAQSRGSLSLPPGGFPLQPGSFPLQPASFDEAAPRGFGDFNNSWAQAMIWWHGNLYVGTSRDSICTSDYAVFQFLELNLGLQFADTYYPYPPLDPALSCAPGLDLSLQAEIWRWSPSDSEWTRVYQSPLAIENPGPGYGQPAPVGAPKLPYETAIRDFGTYIEPDGTEAMYAFTVNSGILWDQTKIPPPRILRTVDGVNWEPLPQDPGTFLGSLPFSSDHSSLRAGLSYNGMMFAISGPVEGEGALIASAHPDLGDNAWFLAEPANMKFYDLAVFNGWLYLGGFDSSGGYAVYKTNAQGAPPYKLITVVPDAGYLTTPFPSSSVVSMSVYNGRLYVGTATFTEVIRINADDTWDLVVGTPRQVPTSSGDLEWKYPTSNLGAGFGNTLNDHAWQMDPAFGFFYIGTYNASTASRLEPNGDLLLPSMGAHLYQTEDGWYFVPITTNGFASTYPISNDAYEDPIDPHGGIFDYGIRTMATTPFGMFLGTADDYYGLAIFRAQSGDSSDDCPTAERPNRSEIKGDRSDDCPAAVPPGRLEVEPARSGGALLSWQSSDDALKYKIFRAELNPIAIRDDTSFEGSGETIGGKIPDVYVGPYSQIGEVNGLNFSDRGVQLVQPCMYLDRSVQPVQPRICPDSNLQPGQQPYMYLDRSVQSGQAYMYYVASVNQKGEISTPSNLTTFPVLLPPVTFAGLLNEVGILNQRGRFDSVDQEQELIARISKAQASAAACQIDAAIVDLKSVDAAAAVMTPDSEDVEVLLGKLVRRLELFTQYPQEVVSDEFCTHPAAGSRR